ncbi:Transposase [Candidatus Methanophagaceae archaeon]|nr:Transposase [Methanophagales archaeon]
MIPNESTGTDKLLGAIEGREAKAVIESTGNMWLRLYLGLEEAGVDVVLANPKKTKAIAEAKLKNDKVDARTLADLLRAKLIAHCYVPPESVRELRGLVRHRISPTRDMTRVKNRLHAILDKYELEFTGTDMFGKAGMMWLWSITSKLTELDQFIFDAELRHIETLKGLIKEVETRIAKEGSPRVRWALVQAARSAVQWDDHYRTKYQRIMERRGDGKAIVAIAREIAVVMYLMINRREVYRFSTDAFKTKKRKKLEGESKKWAKMMEVPAGGITA